MGRRWAPHRAVTQMEGAGVTVQLDVVDRYMNGFRTGDHAAILACLTDDVVWHVHGVRTTRGKGEFDTEIENPAFEGQPVLTVDRTFEAESVVIATGTGEGRIRDVGPFTFAFNDIFTFRDGLIAQVDSYIVRL